MKQILSLLFASFLAGSLQAQLANTKWQGKLDIQGGMDVVFNFGKDTVDAIIPESGQSVETSLYTLTDSVMTFQKLYGGSQCDTTVGKYQYIINGNEMTLSLISDSCYDRATAIGTMKLEKKE